MLPDDYRAPVTECQVIEIYALCCPETQEIRYIGKANDSAKRLKSHLKDAKRRKTPVYCWINKLLESGKTPLLRIIDKVAPSEWKAAEIYLISKYKQTGKLLNLAKGGDEPYCPAETRKKNGTDSMAAGCNRIITKLRHQIGQDENLSRKAQSLQNVDYAIAKLGRDKAANKFLAAFPWLSHV